MVVGLAECVCVCIVYARAAKKMRMHWQKGFISPPSANAESLILSDANRRKRFACVAEIKMNMIFVLFCHSSGSYLWAGGRLARAKLLAPYWRSPITIGTTLCRPVIV